MENRILLEFSAIRDMLNLDVRRILTFDRYIEL